MTMTPELTGLDSVRALLATADPEGRLVPCGLHELIVGPDVLPAVVSVVETLKPGTREAARHVVVIVDETPIFRASGDSGQQDVKAEVVRLLSESSIVTKVVLTDGSSELHVTEGVVQQAIAASRESDVLVAVGGGTISDIGKLVATELPGLPVVSVMTAASVDGYTDNVSVTLKDGVKRTVPSVWPHAVIADAETVAGAPSRMNRAGYGEMTSMYVAPADWRLAALIGIDDTFHPGPIALLDALSSGLDACAQGIASGDPESVAAVDVRVGPARYRHRGRRIDCLPLGCRAPGEPHARSARGTARSAHGPARRAGRCRLGRRGLRLGDACRATRCGAHDSRECGPP